MLPGHDHRSWPAAETGPRRRPRLDLDPPRRVPAVWTGQYSFRCREQAWEATAHNGSAWEQSAPQIKDPHRLPDSATLRRWAWRRLLSVYGSLKTLRFCSPGWRSFLRAPTILAWDWSAARRTLLLEANQP
jgi:hypothetical protein